MDESPVTLQALKELAGPGAPRALYDAAHEDGRGARAYVPAKAVADKLILMGLLAEVPLPRNRTGLLLTDAGHDLGMSVDLEQEAGRLDAVLALIGRTGADDDRVDLVRRAGELYTLLTAFGALPRSVPTGVGMRLYQVTQTTDEQELAGWAVEIAEKAHEAQVRDADRRDRVISDAQLDLWEQGTHKGESGSVPALRPLTPQERYLAKDEATALMNTTPGYTMASAMAAAARGVREGRTPGLDAAKALIAYDPSGTKAAAHAAEGGSWGSFREQAGA